MLDVSLVGLTAFFDILSIRSTLLILSSTELKANFGLVGVKSTVEVASVSLKLLDTNAVTRVLGIGIGAATIEFEDVKGAVLLRTKALPRVSTERVRKG